MHSVNSKEGSILIEVKGLTKKYGGFTAVNNVSFTIEKGHVYVLLGPNGAGKSTIMNIIGDYKTISAVFEAKERFAEEG